MRKHYDIHHFVFMLLIGGLFGAAIVLSHALPILDQRDREIGFLRAEYFAAMGLAEAALQNAERAADVTEAYAREAVYLKREQRVDRLRQRIEWVWRIQRTKPDVSSERVARAIIASGEAYNLNIRWWASQVEQESLYDPEAVSKAGACGLAQILPTTAERLGLGRKCVFDMESNLVAGASYMALHLKTYRGSMRHALYRYSGGEQNYYEQIQRRVKEIKI